MRCLVAADQEHYPENSLKRANICDELILLYIVDRRVLEKVRTESSYVLPSHAIEEMEKFAVEMQRREAERIANKHGAELKFVVDDYYAAIEREILRISPDIFLTDFWHRRFLSYGVPVWVDRGGHISTIGFFVGDVARLNSVRRSQELLADIAGRIGADLCIVPLKEEIARVLPGERCSGEPDAMAVQRRYFSRYRDWRRTIVLV